MMDEAASIGPATIALFEAIMKAKPHPEQGFRSCMGVLSLVKSYGSARVEAACRRGVRAEHGFAMTMSAPRPTDRSRRS